MNIAFDAKRAFVNQSGLGNYSRTLIRSLAQYFPDNHYTLFTTKREGNEFSQKNISVVLPERLLDKKISSRWRSYGITELLSKNKIDIYHGLSNELPFNIGMFKGKKIVTIHDLIFLRYPKLYPLIDRKIYDKKSRAACQLADVIVATSEQTKNDIVEFYGTDTKKIQVVYQSCNEVYRTHSVSPKGGEGGTQRTTEYKLPAKYLLSVGTIEERKNLLTLVKSLTIIKDIHLVVVGKKKKYFKKVQQFIKANGLENRITFLENVPNEVLPVLYQGAEIFIYPSLFEGFGIPIIEALSCGTPVITSQVGCFAEAGGKNSVYINPNDHEQLALEIKRLLSSAELRKKMSEKGLEHSKIFLPQVIAAQMMKIYSS